MNAKRILTIFLVIVIVASGILLFIRKNKIKDQLVLPESTPSVTDQLREKFSGLTIPEDTEKIELTNVSGGEGMGIATKTEIYADLPELGIGESYQVFVSNSSESSLLGTLHEAKGGWILEYDLSKYPGYNNIYVVKGSIHILEGTFTAVN